MMPMNWSRPLNARGPVGGSPGMPGPFGVTFGFAAAPPGGRGPTFMIRSPAASPTRAAAELG